MCLARVETSKQGPQSQLGGPIPRHTPGRKSAARILKEFPLFAVEKLDERGPLRLQYLYVEM